MISSLFSSVLLVAFAGAVAAVMTHVPAHSIQPPYSTLSHWYWAGSTEVTTSGFRLTPDEANKRGWVWNIMPAHSLGDDWSVKLQVRMYGRNHASSAGGGLAFWYTKDFGIDGPVFGNMDRWHGLGVFLDTTVEGQPWVSGWVNDGTHSWKADATRTAASQHGCRALLRGEAGADARDVTVFVHYARPRVEVLVATSETDGKPQKCLELRDVVLPAGSYFGVSASTGEVRTDVHELLSMVVSKDLQGRVEQPHDYVETDYVPTEEEMEDINTLVEETGIVRLVRELGKTHAQRMHDMEARLAKEVEEKQKHLVELVERLSETNDWLEGRLRVMEGRVYQLAGDAAADMRASSNSWMLPFLALAFLAFLAPTIGLRACRKLLR